MSQPSADAQPKTVGAFDVRVIIGAVIGLFGAILLIMGLFFGSQSELDKSGGIPANLIAGIVMLAITVIFIAWSRLRPILLPPEAELEAEAAPTAEAKRARPERAAPGGPEPPLDLARGT